MRRFIAMLSIASLTFVLGVSMRTPSAHAWGWGANDQENYQFNPQNRDEILKYGPGLGANWSEEIQHQAYASKAKGENGAYGQTKQNMLPSSTN